MNEDTKAERLVAYCWKIAYKYHSDPGEWDVLDYISQLDDKEIEKAMKVGSGRKKK